MELPGADFTRYPIEVDLKCTSEHYDLLIANLEALGIANEWLAGYLLDRDDRCPASLNVVQVKALYRISRCLSILRLCHPAKHEDDLGVNGTAGVSPSSNGQIWQRSPPILARVKFALACRA